MKIKLFVHIYILHLLLSNMKFYFYLYHFLSTKSNPQMAVGLTTISNLENIHKHLKEAQHDAKD